MCRKCIIDATAACIKTVILHPHAWVIIINIMTVSSRIYICNVIWLCSYNCCYLPHKRPEVTSSFAQWRLRLGFLSFLKKCMLMVCVKYKASHSASCEMVRLCFCSLSFSTTGVTWSFFSSLNSLLICFLFPWSYIANAKSSLTVKNRHASR